MKKYIFFNTEPNCNILGLNPIIRAFWMQEMKDLTGYNLPDFIYQLEEGVFQAGCQKKEWFEMSDALFKKFVDDHSFADNLRDSLEEGGQKLYNYAFEKLNKYKAGELSEDEKKKVILKLFDKFTAICVPGLVGPIIEFGSGGMTDKIKKILQDKDTSVAGVSVPEALAILTTSNKKIWTEEARDEMYKVAQKLYELKADLNNLKDRVKSGGEDQNNKSKEEVQIKKQEKSPKGKPDYVADEKELVEKYVEDWGWVYYGYAGPKYTVQNAVEELKVVLEKEISPQEELGRLQKEAKERAEKQEEIMQKISLTEDERYFIEAAQDFGYTKAYRANLMALADYVINMILEDFARQEGYSIKQIGVCSLREVSAYIEGKSELPHVDVLNKRLKYCLFHSKPEGDLVLIGDEAKQWIEENVEIEEVDENLTELSGTVACTGGIKKATGIAKTVLSAKDLDKVEEGDILISTTTVPEYVPAMRKASAIATETGGLTCHAAIVSREMNKPCLIGVKHLLKIFKDGEEVEVNLEEGVVRKV